MFVTGCALDGVALLICAYQGNKIPSELLMLLSCFWLDNNIVELFNGVFMLPYVVDGVVFWVRLVCSE